MGVCLPRVKQQLGGEKPCNVFGSLLTVCQALLREGSEFGGN